MHKWKYGDFAGYQDPERGYVYGIVQSVEKDVLKVRDLHERYDFFEIPLDQADYYPTVNLDLERFVKFIRYEISYQEFAGDVYPPQRFYIENPYLLRAEDLLSAAKKIKQVGKEQAEREWIKPMEDMSDCFQVQVSEELLKNEWSIYKDIECFDYQERIPIANAYDRLMSYYWEQSADEAIDLLEQYVANEALPWKERTYTVEAMEAYVLPYLLDATFQQDEKLKAASEEEMEKLIWFTEKLCALKDPVGLQFKAYACSGGNRAYPCDWCAARDALLCLMERPDASEEIANMLGIIYDEGRCTNGVPDYEKAFHYFSIGAAGGSDESGYRLSDMFLQGHYVPQNYKTVLHILTELYEKHVEVVRDGNVVILFPEIALRMGNLYRFGKGVRQDDGEAYYYYLQADFTLQTRIKQGRARMGDDTLARTIRQAMQDVLPKTRYRHPESKLNLSWFDLEKMLDKEKMGQKISVTITRITENNYSLRFKRVIEMPPIWHFPQIFVTLPEAHYCGFLDQFRVDTIFLRNIHIRGFDGRQITLPLDEVDSVFKIEGREATAIIIADGFLLDLEAHLYPKFHRIATVTFPNSTRSYDYLCDGLELAHSDQVIVMTREGEKHVRVINVTEKSEVDLELPITAYKSILRKA